MSTHESRSQLRPISAGNLSDELPSHGYPLEMVGIVEAANGQRVTVRPILPLDAAKFQAFVKNLSDASRSHRFLHGLRELPEQLLHRLTQVDYRTHMALVAEVLREGMPIIIAEARYAVDPENESAELAVVVADDWQGLGLAKALLKRLAGHAAAAGLRRLTGETRASNARIVQLAQRAGSRSCQCPGSPGCYGFRETLRRPPLPRGGPFLGRSLDSSKA